MSSTALSDLESQTSSLWPGLATTVWQCGHIQANGDVTDLGEVLDVAGHEALDQTCQIKVVVRPSPSAEQNPNPPPQHNHQDILGQPLCLKAAGHPDAWEDTNTLRRTWLGIATSIEQCTSTPLSSKSPAWHITLESTWALLKRRQKPRIFHQKTAKEIVQAVAGPLLQAHGCKLVFAINKRSTKKRPLTIQYQQTDFDFLARILAEEGWPLFISSHNHQETVHVGVDGGKDAAGWLASPKDVLTLKLGRQRVTSEIHIESLKQKNSLAQEQIHITRYDWQSKNPIRTDPNPSQPAQTDQKTEAQKAVDKNKTHPNKDIFDPANILKRILKSQGVHLPDNFNPLRPDRASPMRYGWSQKNPIQAAWFGSQKTKAAKKPYRKKLSLRSKPKPKTKPKNALKLDPAKIWQHIPHTQNAHMQQKPETIASRTLAAHRGQAQRWHGQSNVAFLQPGMHIQIDGNPKDEEREQAEPQAFLVVAVEHFGLGLELGSESKTSHPNHTLKPAYSNRFELQPMACPYVPLSPQHNIPMRPLLATVVDKTQRSQNKTSRATKSAKTKPTVTVTTTTITKSPPNRAIADKQGRILVRFPWQSDAHTSNTTWLRTVQPWAGANHGWVGLPRPGTEVLVVFAHGDPDDPLVVGSLYNAANPNPAPKLPSPHCSGLISSGGQDPKSKKPRQHQILLNDAPGKETLNITTDNHLHLSAKGKHRLQVAGNSDTQIQGESKARYAANHSIKILKNQRMVVDQRATHTFRQDLTQVVAGKSRLTYKGDQKVHLRGNQHLRIHGHAKSRIDSAWQVHTQGQIKHQSQKVFVAKAPSIALKASQAISLQVGQARITLRADGTLHIKGVRLGINAKKKIALKAPKIQHN